MKCFRRLMSSLVGRQMGIMSNNMFNDLYHENNEITIKWKDSINRYIICGDHLNYIGLTLVIFLAKNRDITIMFSLSNASRLTILAFTKLIGLKAKNNRFRLT